MIKVDAHTHWGRAWRERDGADPARWLAVMAGYGVTHAVVLPEIGLIDAGRIADDHDNIAATCAAAARSSGGAGGCRMVPFCTASIWYRDDALAEIRRCLGRLGFRGVKFHPWLQGLSVSAPPMDDVCDLAEEYGVPVIFHDGTPTFSLPSQIALLARRHPRVQIILGHCGLFEHYREAIAAMRSMPNLWGCLCGPHLAGLKALVRGRGCDRSRLLWGSDFGYGLSDVLTYRMPLMDQIGMSDADRQAIFSDNPARLLGLQP